MTNRFFKLDVNRSLSPQRVAVLGGLLMLAWGVNAAFQVLWTCDDAFISFRYALNLVEGHGLVFNPGEWIEGYTNFSWTLWSALGLFLGFSAENWAHCWSILCYAGCLLLLLHFHLRLHRESPGGAFPLPVAALAGALHPDWNIYASSGLETSFYTLLLLAAFILVTGPGLGGRRLLGIGLVMAAAFLTRPDGALPAFVIGLFVLWRAPHRFRAGMAYALGFLVVSVPFLAWRFGYYGELVPNTYYAKSAYLSWYKQGWQYVWIYFKKYWALLWAFPLAFYSLRSLWSRARGGRDVAAASLVAQGTLAAALALTYIVYLVRVGGDFMFARMLIPITPFLLILLELGLVPIVSPRAIPRAILALLLCGAVLLTPSPVTDEEWHHGIADEWLYYSPLRVAAIRHKASVLKRFFEGLPVRLAYLGAEARVAYYARIPTVIDCYGLTDRYIARQELEQRGRVGHEKLPPLSYLVGERRAHFIFNLGAAEILNLPRYLPIREIRLADIRGFILHWDPALLAELKRRGARFEDFPTELDDYIQRMDHLPDETVREDFAKFDLFYFRHVDDPPRATAFRRRLDRG